MILDHKIDTTIFHHLELHFSIIVGVSDIVDVL